MGDLRDWAPEPNGYYIAEKPPLNPLSNQTLIVHQVWVKAEEIADSIIGQVQPTAVSEERRKSVVDYVQRLLRNALGCEVFPFGSVPLKTYLPDGDIDLTAFGRFNVEEALASNVCSVLEREDQNMTEGFVVKDVQLIRAEVKLVKCLVQNIVVDISFNQLGGLCTLCFLEQADQYIGKDHIFKRSIILIKAWCYYESRILGAHHGLISTYALETLVLYVFHLFHSSLGGPLAVLFKFLDYFSKFDWDNYCVSLNGPVRISSLPDIVVESPENGGEDLLLSNDFLRDCVGMFSVPAKPTENISRSFQPKHLNIVDPLKENNNLGRSVSKGNFYRIRSAFAYGARKLGQILSQPEEKTAFELRIFFSNTLDRHGLGKRPDVQDHLSISGRNGLSRTSFSGAESAHDQIYDATVAADSKGAAGRSISSNQDSLSHGENGFVEVRTQTTTNKHRGYRMNNANDILLSEINLSSSAKDRPIDDAVNSSSVPTREESGSNRHKSYFAPHQFFHSSRGDLEVTNGIQELKQAVSSNSIDESGFSWVDQHEEQSMNQQVVSPSWISSYQCQSPKDWNALSDLSGDYENHLNSLCYVRRCYEYPFNSSTPLSPTFLSQAPNWSMQYGHNPFSLSNGNSIIPIPVFYPMIPPVLPRTRYTAEEMPKARGTGTYFPNTNHYRDGPMATRGRNQASPRSPRNNIRLAAQDTNFSERNHRDSAQGYLLPKSAFSDLHYTTPEGVPRYRANGLSHPSDNRAVEHGSFPYIQSGASSPNGVWLQNPDIMVSQDSSLHISAPAMQTSKNVTDADQHRITLQSQKLNLKDEGDFPPLSS